MTQSPYVVTVTAQNFQSVVLDGSFDRPVLVDFWADWCAPCRMLMPMLAKLAQEYGGRFLLAKINTEEEQALAAQFGIRSLPTVQFFRPAGRWINSWAPCRNPRSANFSTVIFPHASDGLLTRALDRMAAGNLAGARALIEQARAEDPDNVRLPLADVRLTVAQGRIAEAQAALDGLPIQLVNDPEVAALRGQLRFASALEGAPPETELAARVAIDPRGSQARYRLAAHQVLRGDYASALEHLLELMKHDRAFEDDAGRKGILAVFDLLDGGDDLVARYRARMMNILY